MYLQIYNTFTAGVLKILKCCLYQISVHACHNIFIFLIHLQRSYCKHLPVQKFSSNSTYQIAAECHCGLCKHKHLTKCCACNCECGQRYLWWPSQLTCKPCGCQRGICTAFESAWCCGCFPSTSTVTLEDGKLVTMAELQKGDKVQTSMII